MRHHNYEIKINNNWDSYETYFKNIDLYNNHKGRKLLLYYEDILNHKIDFINSLYNFLDVKNLSKNYILSNIDKLYDLSSKGENRFWGGIISNSTDFYYKKYQNLLKINLIIILIKN